jgi:cephalosporin hydroxylase
MAEAVVDAFHRLWYDSRCWTETAWFGVPIQKNPFDLFQYQELIAEQKPEVVIECGAFRGGSTLYFAHLLDNLGDGMVVSVDIEDGWHDAARRHPRVHVVVGDSKSPTTLERVRRLVPAGAPALVILDSDHTESHVLAELRAYREFVPIGGYLIVEDTNINGHPVLKEFGPGPWEAVRAFLSETKDFVVDTRREGKLHFTFAPHGWLRRIAGA